MNIQFSSRGFEDYVYWQNFDKRILKKVNDLLRDISRNPYEGIGKPEQRHGFVADGHHLARLDGLEVHGGGLGGEIGLGVERERGAEEEGGDVGGDRDRDRHGPGRHTGGWGGELRAGLFPFGRFVRHFGWPVLHRDRGPVCRRFHPGERRRLV